MGHSRAYSRWFTPGIGVKRWLLLLLAGIGLIALGLALGILKLIDHDLAAALSTLGWLETIFVLLIGASMIALALTRLSNNILAPYRRHQHGPVADVIYAHTIRHKGPKVVAIGGGTGLPSTLRGIKTFTSNITAVVTVADDGGSSGRLRRDLGVLPPGDLRNNIAALADDESLMTRLFQYRFDGGDLGGHAFGNLFISALAGVSGSLESALIETERVLNIQGRVLPSTLDDVTLTAQVRLPGRSRTLTITGESKITAAGGQIEQVALEPASVAAYSESARAILEAGIVVIGPGSLYTSLLPNLLVRGIAEALRATDAYKIYVCNVAMQPGETDGYTVADHVIALEKHIGRGMFQAVIANNNYPPLEGENSNTRYVRPAPEQHEIVQRYKLVYADLVDSQRPWRHDPSRLASAILSASSDRVSAPALAHA